MTRLSQAKYYTKLDLRVAYNLVRVAEGEEWKSAFRRRYGHFEYTVMPIGLTNAPVSVQHLINYTLREFLDIFCTAYLYDILIYSDTLEEHKQHVRMVRVKLREAKMLLWPEKCEFHTQQTGYLGLIITPGGIEMDHTKIKTVVKWEPLKHLKDVQTFLGFSNFYRRFVLGYLSILPP